MNGIKYRKPEEMKDSGLVWIGSVPIDWSIVKVKHKFRLKKTRSYAQEPVVLSLTQRGIVPRDISNNEGQIAASYDGYISIKIGDFVLNPMDLISGYVDKSKFVGVISPAYTTFTSLIDNINKDYYKYYFQMHYHHNFLFPYGEGVSYDHRWTLKNETFLNYPIVSFSSALQEKIANFLDIKTAQFDYIIAKKELLIQKLEEAKKSLISEVVTGKAKIIDGEMVPRQPEEMKDSGVEWLGMIPKDWEVKRVKYLLKESIERSLHGKEEPLSMSQKHGLIRSSDMERIPNQAMSLKGNKKCKAGDLVFNKLKSHLGVFSVSAQEGIVSPDYAVYRPIENSNAKYLEYLFKTPLYINEFNRYSKGVGAGLTRLYTDDLFNIVALYPKREEQQCMVEFINTQLQNTDSVIQKNNFQIQNLKQAKQSLISEAVTGKIDLRDWEIIEVGEVQ